MFSRFNVAAVLSNLSLRRGVQCLALIAVFFTLAACCWFRAWGVGLKIGEFTTADQRRNTYGSDKVYFCPKDVVSVAWFTDSDFEKASVDPFGAVTLPWGAKTVPLNKTTEFKLECEGGGCEAGDSATAFLVTDGQTAQVAASRVETRDPVTGTAITYWETSLAADAWSPSLAVTSIKMLPFPSNQTNATEWNQPVPWQMTKTDTNGNVRSFAFGWSAMTPWSGKMPVVGKYHLSPGPGTYPLNTPLYANFEITMACQ